ncbi:hypothetical protein [Yoonia sp. SDW83-1]|uniref:hypothetical protein n=1 Tax=Yoonia sp. SDW83-1 TaxID=3366945 RepID=UPI00398C4B90
MPLRKSAALWDIERHYAREEQGANTESEVRAREAWQLKLFKRTKGEDYQLTQDQKTAIRETVLSAASD